MSPSLLHGCLLVGPAALFSGVLGTKPGSLSAIKLQSGRSTNHTWHQHPVGHAVDFLFVRRDEGGEAAAEVCDA
jgi:hypothetical protein